MEADGNDYRTARRKVRRTHYTMLCLSFTPYQALARDGFHCMLTGMYDYKSTQQSSELDQLRRSRRARAATVQACHILNQSTMQGVDPTGDSEENTIVQTSYAATAMSFLIDFGLDGLAHELLATDGVHDLGNLLSLENGVYADFGRLNLWFECTDEVRHS